MEKYELCVIGGGPAGYSAAMRAMDFKKKTILIEKEKIGGAGLYNGAFQSKAMWELAKDVATTRQKMVKLSSFDNFQYRYKDVQKELNSAVNERAHQLEKHLDLLTTDDEYKDLFTLSYGTGRFLSKNEVEITATDGTKKVIWAEHIILATGSRPRYLPNIPIDEKIIVTSDGVHKWDRLPDSMVILGAGVIGCEYATIFSNLGRTKVFLIDKAPRILPFEDEDIVNVIESNLEGNGVTIHRNSKLLRMEIVNGEVEYELEYESGEKKVYQVEKALVSVGRVPNTENIGIEKTGIELTERGHIEDDDTQTMIPNIYAVGDITADMSLVNVGELEGRHATRLIFNPSGKKVTYDNVSTIMFLKPEVAGVGLNEIEAQKKGICYKVVRIDYSSIPRALAMGVKQGFFKILVTNDAEMKILGMRALGTHASSAIQAVALLIQMNKGIAALSDMIYPHPSIVEGIRECARCLLGKPVFKPRLFKEIITMGEFGEDGKYKDLSHEIKEVC
ncbi:MAG: NAD(P)/FAD-dependent oxidoreductase [Cyclobacteriaceae bacterium]